MNTINNTNETLNPTENMKTSGSSESRSEITKKNYSYLYLIKISKETEKAIISKSASRLDDSIVCTGLASVSGRKALSHRTESSPFKRLYTA